MSLSAEESSNGTFNLSYLNFRLCRSKPSTLHDNTYLFTHDLTRSPTLSTWVTHVKRMRRVMARASNFFGRTVFHRGYKYPSPSSLLFYSARPHSRSSFSNPSATATLSSPVRKSFVA